MSRAEFRDIAKKTPFGGLWVAIFLTVTAELSAYKFFIDPSQFSTNSALIGALPGGAYAFWKAALFGWNEIASGRVNLIPSKKSSLH